MLGVFDPITITTAASLIGKMESFLGIGAGRREADQIVPYQNEIHYNVLAPISKALETPQDLTYNELQTMFQVLADTESAWLRFLHNTNWSDGRAATQAEATLEPYFTDFKNRIQSLLGTMVPIIPDPWIPDLPYIDRPIPGVLPTNIPDPTATALPGQQTAALPSWLFPVVAIGFIFMLSQGNRRRR